MKMSDTAYMMCKQAAAADQPPVQFAEQFYDWAKDRVVWYRALGGVDPLEVLGCIIAMADRGVKVVLVDNLQFCGVTDDTERERLFMNQLLGIAEAKDVHICLVHHVRKPQAGGDEYVPTRFDVRGGATIVDQAHLLFIVWHNKRRQKIKQFQVMGEKLNEKEQLILAEPDLKLIVAKQRNGPYEGHINLWEGKGLTFKKAEGHRSMHIEFPRS
jgi:twinkle protein